MKRVIFIFLSSSILSACASTPSQTVSQKASQYEIDRARTVKIENSMREQQIKADQEFDIKALDSGCVKHAIEASKTYFSMAQQYYGTNPAAITESPQSWATIATQACVLGYEAGVNNQPQSMLDRHLYSIKGDFTNPFQYKAVVDSMYWGYGRSIR